MSFTSVGSTRGQRASRTVAFVISLDNSEIGEAVMADVVFPASASVLSSLGLDLQWVLLGEDLVISPTYEVGVAVLIPRMTSFSGQP